MNKYWLKGGSVITCKGGEILNDTAILIENGRIAKVCPIADWIPEDTDEVIDTAGKYIMPGLIDCHVHIHSAPSLLPMDTETTEKHTIRGVSHLKEYLSRGFTTIRSVGGPENVEVELKKAVAEGIIDGPRMVVAGQGLTMTGGHLSVLFPECDTVGEVIKASREQIKKGADVVKLFVTGGVTTPGPAKAVQFNLDQIRAAVEAAHALGKKAAAHCIGREGVLLAAKAGVDSIEHGVGLDEEGVEYLLKNNIYLVPTLKPGYSIINSPDKHKLPPFLIRKTEEFIEGGKSALLTARAAGVKIAMGTDAGSIYNCHGTGYEELEYWIECGLTPAESIQAATAAAAELLGLDGICGSIEVGKAADLIILDENPLINISALRDIGQVINGGDKIEKTNF